MTVAVCAYTFDRWDDVCAGMAALSSQTRQPLQILLVIDHNDEMLARARGEFAPGVEVVANAHTRGASGARNTAYELAQGDVVAFLDDDAVPDPDWIERLVEAYTDPWVLAVGGTAVPRWPERRPAQLAPELDWIIGCTYEGQPTNRAEVRNLWGCNMSTRREAFAWVGGFDENVGRVGLIPLGAEETEFCIRLGRLDPRVQIIFEPSARVHHRVTPERTTWAYLRRRSMAEGLSKAAITVAAGDEATSVERSYLLKVIPAGMARELRRGLRGDRDGWSALAGLFVSVGLTAIGYLRGRAGLRGRAERAAIARRAS